MRPVCLDRCAAVNDPIKQMVHVCFADLRQSPAAPNGDNILGQHTGDFTHGLWREPFHMPREKLRRDALEEIVLDGCSRLGLRGVLPAGNISMSFPGKIAGILKGDFGEGPIVSFRVRPAKRYRKHHDIFPLGKIWR